MVVQLVDYIKGGNNPSLTQDYLSGWGTTQNQQNPWELNDLISLRKEIEEHGLKLEAIENFDPSHWHDILLDGPKKHEQLELIKRTIQNIGKAGIVKDAKLIEETARDLSEWLHSQPDWRTLGIVPSPIKGADGNREFLLAGEKNA